MTAPNCIDCIPRYARKRGTSYGICEQHFLEALTRAGAQMNATGGALSFATVPVVAPGAASVLAAAPVEQRCSCGHVRLHHGLNERPCSHVRCTCEGYRQHATIEDVYGSAIKAPLPGIDYPIGPAPKRCSRGFADCGEDHEREPRCGDCGGPIRYVALAETWECRAAWCTWSSTNPIPEAA